MNRIKELRKANNLTLKQLGERLSMRTNTLSYYENGDREPKLKMWEKLANFFKVPVSYIQGVTFSKEDIFKLLNNSYYSYLQASKGLVRNDPVNKELFVKARYFLKITGKSIPENVISDKDFKGFSKKALEYWQRNFEFLMYCEEIEYLLFQTKLSLLNIDSEHKKEYEQKYVEIILKAIESMNNKLTSTQISDLYSNSDLKLLLQNFLENAGYSMRFESKKSIQNSIFDLQKELESFSLSLQYVSENSQKQYPVSVVNERLDSFIKEGIKQKEKSLYSGMFEDKSVEKSNK